MYPDSSEGLNKETEEGIYFFSTSFEMLNNFSAHKICIWNKEFPTAEHAFQWKKYTETHPDIAEKILVAPSPYAVKKISDANKVLQPETWKQDKILVMEEILIAKTKQNPDVVDALKRSGNRRIVENSPVDSFWGIGPDSKGNNQVGKIWMKIRDNLEDLL